MGVDFSEEREKINRKSGEWNNGKNDSCRGDDKVP